MSPTADRAPRRPDAPSPCAARRRASRPQPEARLGPPVRRLRAAGRALCIGALGLCTLQLGAAGPAHAEERPFSSEAGVAVYPSMLSGIGVERGFFTTALVRVDAFALPRSAPGPRLGLSVWGAFPFGAKPTLDLDALGQGGDDQPSAAQVELWQYGVLAAVRSEPDRPVGLDAAFGFGRTDLRGAPLAATALPALTGELGLRHRLVGPAQLSWTLRATWLAAPPTGAQALAAVSAPAGQASEDWWTVQLGPSLSLPSF